MGKTYREIETEPVMAAEPIAPYTASTYHATTTQKKASAREHVMASTVSVDEYFDELISQVRRDYANI